MRRHFSSIVILFLLASVSQSFGATGRVIKVLPHFLDLKGRAALSPSLYDRDVYQVILRDHPERRSGIRFDMQWRTKPKPLYWNTLLWAAQYFLAVYQV